MTSIPPTSALSIASPSASSSSYPLSSSFRARRLGRAASPPTWAWYEQIQPPESDSDSERDDEEDEDESDHDHQENEDDEGEEPGFEMDFENVHVPPPSCALVLDEHEAEDGDGDGDVEMEMELEPPVAVVVLSQEQGHEHERHDCTAPSTSTSTTDADEELARKLAKGKQRAVSPPASMSIPSPPVSEERVRRGSNANRKTKTSHRSRHSEPSYRPILTIHRSQGFVWNQDLFVPAYIKDRYVTSTSPPGESCISLTASPHSSTPNQPYDTVEVVEIRVTGQELNDWM